MIYDERMIYAHTDIILAGLDEVQIEFAGNWNPDIVYIYIYIYEDIGYIKCPKEDFISKI